MVKISARTIIDTYSSNNKQGTSHSVFHKYERYYKLQRYEQSICLNHEFTCPDTFAVFPIAYTHQYTKIRINHMLAMLPRQSYQIPDRIESNKQHTLEKWPAGCLCDTGPAVYFVYVFLFATNDSDMRKKNSRPYPSLHAQIRIFV